MVTTIFTNARVLLDGASELQAGLEVLVEDGLIRAVSASPLPRPPQSTVIDAGQCTLMPGLIDAHAHIMGLSLTPKNFAYPAAEITVASVDYLRNCLMDGFTTIREAGGADHATARLLAEGRAIGPRLFYSGKALTQTGGGADFRTPDEHLDPCGHVGPFSNMSVIADGSDEVRRAAREELRKGATQIKLFASGGVVFPAEGHASRYEFSDAELRAAVEEAAARDTYVMAHVYTDDGVRRCLAAGVRSIEHGNFVTEETVAMMAAAGAFLVPTFISLVQRIESAAENHLTPAIVANLERTRRPWAAGLWLGPQARRADRLWHRPVGADRAEVATARVRNAQGPGHAGRDPALGDKNQCRFADARGPAGVDRRGCLSRPANSAR